MKHIVSRFWYPCLFIGMGLAAGLIPSVADGGALAIVPHSGWMIFSIWALSYGVGVFVGMTCEKVGRGK